MALKFQTFKVRFSGQFPLDMLRYDGCYPTTSEDVQKIHGSFDGERGVHEVTLTRRVENKKDQPTIGRWESFACRVSDIQVR